MGAVQELSTKARYLANRRVGGFSVSGFYIPQGLGFRVSEGLTSELRLRRHAVEKIAPASWSANETFNTLSPQTSQA